MIFRGGDQVILLFITLFIKYSYGRTFYLPTCLLVYHVRDCMGCFYRKLKGCKYFGTICRSFLCTGSTMEGTVKCHMYVLEN